MHLGSNLITKRKQEREKCGLWRKGSDLWWFENCEMPFKLPKIFGFVGAVNWNIGLWKSEFGWQNAEDSQVSGSGAYTADEYLKVTEAQPKGAVARLQQEGIEKDRNSNALQEQEEAASVLPPKQGTDIWDVDFGW